MKRTRKTTDVSALGARTGQTPHGNRRAPLFKKFLFGLIPLLVLLALMELVCRLLPAEGGRQTQAGFVEPDPDLIWRLKVRDQGPLATNELGHRDTSYNAAADVKVLLLGDSVSWGDGVADLRQCYPFLLELQLAALVIPRTCEVINAGVPGYSTFQQAIYLEKHGLKLKPDLVVLQFCLNDVVERYHTLAQYGGDDVFLGIDTGTTASGWFDLAVRHSRALERLARFLKRQARQREAYDVELLAQDELGPELTEAWNRAIDEIDSIHRLTQQHGIPMLLVIAPYQFQAADPLKRRQPQDRLLAMAAARGIHCVDLLPGMVAFAQQQGLPPTVLFNDPSHFSIFGHEAAASLLVKPVLELSTTKPSSAGGRSTAR